MVKNLAVGLHAAIILSGPAVVMCDPGNAKSPETVVVRSANLARPEEGVR